MSVGGAEHRIPQCNHFTLFGSAVSVVEYPTHRKLLCWTLQKFPVRRSCLTVGRLSFCGVSPALKALREDCYHWSVPRPVFLEENVAVRFRLGERHLRKLSVFRRSIILKLLIRRPKRLHLYQDCVRAPPLLVKEKYTSARSNLCEKYQDHQSEGGVFRSSSAYEKTVRASPFC